MSDITPDAPAPEPEVEPMSELEAAVAAQFQDPPGDGGGDGDGFQPSVDVPPASVEPEPEPDVVEPEPVEPTPTLVEPTVEEAFDFAQAWEKTYGRPLTPQTAGELMQLVEHYQSIPPEAWSRLTEPETPAAPVVAEPDPWAEEDDPRLVAIQERQAALEAQQAAQVAQQQQQYNEWVSNEAVAAADAFVAAAPITLSPEDRVALEQHALRSGGFGAAMQRTGGTNPRQCWADTLEQTLYTVPEFRDRVIEKMADERAQQVAVETARQARAASVGAGGGSAAAIAPPGPPPTDKRGIMDAVAADIAAVQAQNT